MTKKGSKNKYIILGVVIFIIIISTAGVLIYVKNSDIKDIDIDEEIDELKDELDELKDEDLNVLDQDLDELKDEENDISNKEEIDQIKLRKYLFVLSKILRYRKDYIEQDEQEAINNISIYLETVKNKYLNQGKIQENFIFGKAKKAAKKASKKAKKASKKASKTAKNTVNKTVKEVKNNDDIAKITNLTKELESEITKVNDNHNSLINEIKEKTTKTILDIKSKTETEIKNKIDESNRIIKKLNEEANSYTKQINSMISSNNIANLEKINNLKNNTLNNIKSIKSQMDNKINDIKNDYNNKIRILKENTAKNINYVRSKTNEQISSKLNRAILQTDDIINKANSYINTVKTDISQIQDKTIDDINKIKKETATEVNNYNSKINLVKQQSQNLLNEANKIKGNLNDEINTIKEQSIKVLKQAQIEGNDLMNSGLVKEASVIMNKAQNRVLEYQDKIKNITEKSLNETASTFKKASKIAVSGIDEITKIKSFFVPPPIPPGPKETNFELPKKGILEDSLIYTLKNTRWGLFMKEDDFLKFIDEAILKLENDNNLEDFFVLYNEKIIKS